MKNIFYALLAIGLVWSCTDDEEAMMISQATAPVLTVDTRTQEALTADKADSVAVIFSWTKADFGVPTSISYIVEMDATEDFAEPAKVGETTELQLQVTQGELNNALLNKGLNFDEEATVFFRLKATLGTENVQTLFSASAVQGTFTPYNDIPVFTSDVGIIGSATPGVWDFDTDMEDIGGGNYRIEIDLVEGEAKFRQDDDWGVNWGAADFPAGLGTQDGANIPVPTGSYVVTFNKNTGAYSFEAQTSGPTYGIIGAATPGGWDEDTNLNPNGDGTFSLNIELTEGEFKFRQDDAWEIDWGAAAGSENIDENPSGTAELKGANFTTTGGSFVVTFNPTTGEYSFESAISSVGVIGAATPGGWDVDTNMTEVSEGLYEIILQLDSGEFKFRANDAWDLDWGAEMDQEEAADFPSGTAAIGGSNIKVNAGLYKIQLDIVNLTYTLSPAFESLGLIGAATATGWDSDLDFRKVSDTSYVLIAILADGELKIRANDAWDIDWGGIEFPSGTAAQKGSNIAATAGLYRIEFNPISGALSFTPTTVGIIGDATPGGWDADTDLSIGTGDNAFKMVGSMELTGEKEAKFRENDDWTNNWGGDDFPSGTATHNGSNIGITETATYDIIFDPSTGEYSFTTE